MMDAEEFYRLRDDRTIACVGEPLSGPSGVSISMDADAAKSYPNQVAFVVAVNLAARWCRRIRVVAPAVVADPRLRVLLPHRIQGLADLGVGIARAADPFGNFEAAEPREGTWHQLHIGGGGAPDGAYRVKGDGWLALGGDAVSAGAAGSGNPLGAVLAACIGVAWAFRKSLGDIDLPTSVRLSLWNLRGGDDAAVGPHILGGELGRVALVGCGAVGSGMAYLLPLTGLRARLVLVDGDVVDVSNLNRSPLFLFDHVGKQKPSVTASYLQRAGFDARSIPMWFDEAVAAKAVFDVRPDVVVPAANERGVRHMIQHQVPPLQVYGTTGRDWQAFLGRHIPLREDCLACRFPLRVRNEPPLACSTGRVRAAVEEQPGHDAALPFLSAAAAVLATAELMKATASGFPLNPNFACLDFRGPLTDFMGFQKRATPTCVCGSQSAVWRALNGRTRFAEEEPGRGSGRTTLCTS